MTETTLIELPDGRRVAVDTTGPDDGPVLLLCHPAPGSRRLDPDPALTAASGVRLVTIDRPGYGQSDPLPAGVTPTITGFADDAGHVLDRLGVADANVVGWSAGGRVAAALAARRPELVSHLAIVGTPAPDDEVAWIPPDLRAMAEGMRADPAGSVGKLTEQLAPMAEAGAALVTAGDADAAALARDTELATRLTAMVDEGFAAGPMGLAADIISYASVPWGFDPAAIGAPTVCIYGEVDETVPPVHGDWWARRIPGAKRVDVPGVGHILLGEVWSSLLAPRRR